MVGRAPTERTRQGETYLKKWRRAFLFLKHGVGQAARAAGPAAVQGQLRAACPADADGCQRGLLDQNRWATPYLDLGPGPVTSQHHPPQNAPNGRAPLPLGFFQSHTRDLRVALCVDVWSPLGFASCPDGISPTCLRNTGTVCDAMGELDKAAVAYEYSLRHNPLNVQTLSALANIFIKKQRYSNAADYLQRVVKAEPNNGEVWAQLAYTVSSSLPLPCVFTPPRRPPLHRATLPLVPVYLLAPLPYSSSPSPHVHHQT